VTLASCFHLLAHCILTILVSGITSEVICTWVCNQTLQLGISPLRAKGWHNQVEQVYVGVYVLMSVTEVSKTCT